MVEHLYAIGVRHKKTCKESDIFVWAENTDKATHKLTNALFGVHGEYAWIGSGPVYQNNQLVSREREESEYD